MISLDWKERLIKDTDDFVERKLPAGDFDIDIVYNAYPQRIDNKVPLAVITLVGKTLASRLAKKADLYFPFYDYLVSHKGEYGITILSYILAKAIKKNTGLFLDYLDKLLTSCRDQKASNLLIDKAIFPLMKNNLYDHLDLLSRWIKKDNPCLNNSLQKLLAKLISTDNRLIQPIFHKLESSWLYATPNMVKLNSRFLKDISKYDLKFYLNIYRNYQHTRNPVFADILCGGIVVHDKIISELAGAWAQSGNIKLKKIGTHAIKILKKLKDNG
ncbi:MAG: hypothetical protein JW755_12100 [Candidatus Aminicenantes bacterium]|nr:hypothetical protein [Candidatus Aminicenantes bacterium]